MRLLVTGGAGFIGGHAVRNFLSNNDEVLVVDKMTYAAREQTLASVHLLKMDICETSNFVKVVEDFSPDFLVHFAAETHVDNSIKNCKDFIHSNVEGVSSVLDVCRQTKTRLCHVSTDEVYGPASLIPFLETDELNPMNPYSVTKAAGDMLIKSYRNTYGIEYLIIRPSNNYGPRQHNEKFIPKLISCLNNGEKFPLYGVGDQIREWTYVEDTASTVRRMLSSPNIKWNEIYNLSSGISYTNLETINLATKIYNRLKNKNYSIEDVVKNVEDRPGHDKRYWISSKKLDSFVKTEYTDFQSGLEKTIIEHA